jgi:hypothetical protein
MNGGGVNLYVIAAGLTAAAVGGVRHWLTRGRKASPSVNEKDGKDKKSTGTAVPEGDAKADGKKEKQ